ATSKTPEVFFAHDGTFDSCPDWYLNQIYRREQERGSPGLEDLWTPGAVRFHLTVGRQVRFACSTDPIDLRKVKAGGTRGRVPASVAVSGGRKTRVQRVSRNTRGEVRVETSVDHYPPVGERDATLPSGQTA